MGSNPPGMPAGQAVDLELVLDDEKAAKQLGLSLPADLLLLAGRVIG